MVELLEPLAEAEGSRVIVTWVQPTGAVDLRQRGIDESRRQICAAGWPPLQRIGIAGRWLGTMNFRRGDIVSVLFPDSNLRTSKLRPALVVQADQLDSGLPQAICCDDHE